MEIFSQIDFKHGLLDFKRGLLYIKHGLHDFKHGLLQMFCIQGILVSNLWRENSNVVKITKESLTFEKNLPLLSNYFTTFPINIFFHDENKAFKDFLKK